MVPLIFILSTVILLVGFFVLSQHEVRRGTRVFALERNRLDEYTGRVTFILEHVNFGSFLREEINRLAHRVAHDVAHLSLVAVRATERFLTNIVRYLRARRAVDLTPRENAREFVKTLSDFKEQLKETPPEIPDIY